MTSSRPGLVGWTWSPAPPATAPGTPQETRPPVLGPGPPGAGGDCPESGLIHKSQLAVFKAQYQVSGFKIGLLVECRC